MIYPEMCKKIIELLEISKFFDKVELKVFKALLELEAEGKVKSTAGEIARKAGITVTNAYKYLYNLEKLGIVEIEEGKQKLFWLSRVNPFPRILSLVTKEYLEKKAALKTAENIYEKIVLPRRVVEKPRKREIKNKQDFLVCCAYIADLAKNSLCVISDFLPEDFVVLEAFKRCKERHVEMRWLACEMEEEKAEVVKKIGFEIRFVDEILHTFIMVADFSSGIAIESEEPFSAICFLNYPNKFKENFEKLWDSAGEMK